MPSAVDADDGDQRTRPLWRLQRRESGLGLRDRDPGRRLTAGALGISTVTLWRMLKRHRLDAKDRA